MRRKTGSSKGAIELSLTYVYAVLIGIVIFIVATRVIGVQSMSADEQNTRTLLNAFDEIVQASAQDPNLIQQIDVPQANIQFVWDDQTRIRIGRYSSLIWLPVFSEARLGSTISAWTYPYRIDAASSPLLFLSDGTMRYFISNLTPSAEGVRRDIFSETPRNAGTYGLSIGQQTAFTVAGRNLCIRHAHDTNWYSCKVRLVSSRAPYGYLSWNDDRWYPVSSYGEIFAALFSTGERDWVSAIATAHARDTINREVLMRRTDLFDGFDPICDTFYSQARGNLSVVASELTVMRDPAPVVPADIDLDTFIPLRSALANLSAIDRELTRSDCPAVVG